MERYRIILSGYGGQGLITAAIILAETAALYEGMNAVQSQSYGAAARGGLTRSDVIISDQVIDFPKVNQPNVLLCMAQEAYNKYYSMIRPGGLLITDSHLVVNQHKADARQKSLPIYASVMEEIGNPIVLNICTVGVIQALTRVLQPESLEKVVKERVPARFLELNMKALHLGMEIGSSSA